MDRYSAIRSRAQSVIAEYEAKTGHPFERGTRPVIEVLTEIADQCFKLGVVEDSELPDGVVGQLDLKYDTISYGPGLNEGRRAYTVAHEIAHRALEHPEQKVLDTEFDIDESPDFDALTVQNGIYRSYNSKGAYELEANVFAGELLAPLHMVRERLLQQRDWSVESLAAHFGLSKAAMMNQITAALRPDHPAVVKNGITPVLTKDDDHDRAVNALGPALVLAGPGAGKTRILVRRFERLVKEGKIPARRILALTFSNKAASEMRERLSKAMPEHAHELAVFTLHSFGLETLKIHGEHIGYVGEPKLLTPAELIAFLKKNLSKMPLGSFENLMNPASNLGLLLDSISRAKDELASPREYIALAEKQLGDSESDEAELAGRRAIDAGNFYASYEKLLQDNTRADYGDLISLTVRLLEQTPAGDLLRSEYDHILVDEFQDINFASGRLVRALAGPNTKVWAVGDLKQSIYRFRGASPSNIAGFLKDYPGADIITLNTNYRSFQDIVSCGQAVQIPQRGDVSHLPTAKLVAHRGNSPDGPGVRILRAPDGPSELKSVVEAAKEFKARFGANGVAVLCRTRSDAQKASDALEQQGIATSWSGDLLGSAAFKDLFGMLYLAVGDLRGLVRVTGGQEYKLAKRDLGVLLKWTDEHVPSALSAIHAACDGDIHGLSTEGLNTLRKLKQLVGAMGVQPTVFHALATYLFEYSSLVRELLLDERPSARRALTTIRQVSSMARSFRTASPDTQGRLQIREFLEFVEACAQSGKLDAVTPDLLDPDCVTVTTVHGSKGLEWSAVLLPFLAKGKFPNTSHHTSLPIPDGLIKGLDAADEDSEEPCLFYVALTRAKDRLVISVADKYGKAAKPSPLLDHLGPELVANGYLEHVTFAQSLPLSVTEAVIARSEGFQFGSTIPFGMIRTFQRCPKRFEYYYILNLSSGDKGFRDFNRVITDVKISMAESHKEGSLPSLGEALACLDAAWEATGPAGHWYESKFREKALVALTAFHGKLAGGASIAPNQTVELVCDGRTFSIPADEIEDGSPAVLRVVHYDRPAKAHLGSDSKTFLPALLGSVASSVFPGRESSVRISYPLLDREELSTASAGLVAKRPKQLVELATKAESGPYPPKWEAFSCPGCPFALICVSSDVDEETDE